MIITRRRSLPLFIAVSAGFSAVLAPGCALAQSAPRRVNADYLFKPGNITLTLSAGGAAFTDFQQQQANPLAAGQAAMPVFTRRVSAQTTTTAAAGLSVWLTSTTALQIGGSFTPTRFRVINEAPDSRVPIFDDSDTARLARLDVWNADIAVLLRPPVDLGRVYPYAILGGGAVRYQLRGQGDGDLPPEAAAAFSGRSRTQWSAVLGAGAVIPLQRKRLLLTFDLVDHLSRTPIAERRTATAFEDDGTTIVLGPGGEGAGSDGIVLTSHVRLVVGVTIPLRLR